MFLLKFYHRKRDKVKRFGLFRTEKQRKRLAFDLRTAFVCIMFSQIADGKIFDRNILEEIVDNAV